MKNSSNTIHPSKSIAEVVNAAQVFYNEINYLATSNPKVSIYVIDIPDLGKTPFGQNSSDKGNLLNILTGVLNNGISGLKNISNVIFIESNAVFNPTPSEPLMTNCSVIIDPKHICGDPKSNPETNSGSLFFADPVHPSATTHQAIANQFPL